jgi:hypothetical protein
MGKKLLCDIKVRFCVARDGSGTCGANGEDHLDRVEEEEHDEQRHGGSYGQEQSLCGVYGLNTYNTQHMHK